VYIVNTCTEYAFFALKYMAEVDRVTSAQELSEKLDIPQPYLRRILQELTKNKLVSSRRGQKGGFILAKDHEAVNLLLVLDIFQGSVNVPKCNDKKAGCARKTRCILRSHFELLEENLRNQLKSITLRTIKYENNIPV
jgi:Rrf2 family transcriptional regulator, iron-sulfur cluster assembly transcription factor